MLLINHTTNEIISQKLFIANSFLENISGLLRQKRGTSMLFITRFGIHTFFMKYPITVLVLNNKNQIVQIKQNLKPNRIFIWNPKYTKIIELPTPTTNCQLGQILLFES